MYAVYITNLAIHLVSITMENGEYQVDLFQDVIFLIFL
jgi:hypothetical protein